MIYAYLVHYWNINGNLYNWKRIRLTNRPLTLQAFNFLFYSKTHNVFSWFSTSMAQPLIFYTGFTFLICHAAAFYSNSSTCLPLKIDSSSHIVQLKDG